MKKAEHPAENSGNSPRPDNGAPKPVKARLERGNNDLAAFEEPSKGKGILRAQGKKLKRKRKLVLKQPKGSIKIVEGDAVKPGSVGEKKNESTRKDLKENLQSQQEKIGESSDAKPKENKQNDSNKSLKDQKSKNKRDDAENGEKKNGDLGGLIFMCSAKTKPDCFRYKVMGVSMSKKELVLTVRPGLKLFLFDYDLKMMYGIFKASSSGGIKLEPKAFGGAFPAQVRFEIHKDCHPLPESIFKKAIKENFTSQHKFNTELTVQQAKRLAKLFKPADLRLNANACQSQPVGHARVEPNHLDSRGDRNGRRHPVQAHESSQISVYQELPPSCQLYPTEREYRAYGLQGERRNLAGLQHVASALESNTGDPIREHVHRNRSVLHGDTILAQRESMNAAPLYLNGRGYQTYSLGTRPESAALTPAAAVASAGTFGSYSGDPYYTHHRGDPYLAAVRRDELLSGSYSAVGSRDDYVVGTDPLLRRENDQMDRLYSTYVAAPALHRDPLRPYEGTRTETAPLPVSSRYSFPGPSLYR